MRAMRARPCSALPASHPTLTAELMLRHKGIDYRRIDLMPGLHQGAPQGDGVPAGSRCRP